MYFEHSWIFGSVIFWGAIVLFVLIGHYFGYKTRASKHRMMERLAEKGQTLSPELLASLGNGDGHRSPVSGAIVLMFIGVAIAIFFWALGGGGNLFEGEHIPNWLPVIGIFPFAIGLGKLIGLIFERRPPK
jgi:hypothetical protein